MTENLKLTVRIAEGFRILFRTIETFVMTSESGSQYRLESVTMDKATGEFVTSWVRQTKDGRDWRRGGWVNMWPVDLSEEVRGAVLSAIAQALREAYRVPAGCIVVEEGFDSTEVPETVSTTRFDEFNGELSTRENSGLHWMVQSELAHELAQLATTLDTARARKLIAAVCSGLPISLTWDTPFGEDRIERRTTMVLAERLSAPHPTNGALPGRIRAHYWGFTHDVWLDRIVDVTTPGTVSTYLDR